nr:ribonuclease H-like domain, reverse transcriptase, RNA-dependent DNA polymerase [Tanacetum cinerariifolium]
MGYQKTPTMGYQKAPTPSTTRSWKKPNTTASKVHGAGTVRQRLKATVSACESQGLSNTNDITNEESIAAGDNGILEGVGTITAGGFLNNNNIKSEASSGGSGAVRGDGNSKGMSSSGGSGAVRGNFHSKGMSSSGGSRGVDNENTSPINTEINDNIDDTYQEPDLINDPNSPITPPTYTYNPHSEEEEEATTSSIENSKKGFDHVPVRDFDEVFAPFARIETVRLILALAAYHGWQVHHLDVKSSFLHGDLKEEVYVTQPEG